ncbi:MAG: undecaprenyldiphospho-muramoylpentapeptide beta-N-acetylglucosaminyltransferase [Vicinamibacteraceae bacterium]|nr:undecaprenyldiphospho-muramoylpentapeptide beta-N-acetylglucosaminyltransferase [Vicinamibacteraceae bacterium]
MSVRVVFAGGGTGGHLYPGIAVARAILALDPGAVVSFAGTSRGIEERVVPREGFALDVIRSAGLKGKSLRALAYGLALLPLSALDAWRVVTRRRPHVVVGVGGYSSGPVVGLAALRGVPTMVLEQNAVPGLANRLLARLVDAAAVTFADTRRWFGDRAFVSGNPARAEFFGVPPLAPRAAGGPWRLLVFGGSLGAHAINVAMAAAAPDLAASPRPIDIVHQTGERDAGLVADAYRHAGVEATVVPYITDMAGTMAGADLLVCRAGATTLAEVTAAGRPAILVPLPTATDDHQRRNAEALAGEGAAVLLPQTEIVGSRLAREVLSLLDDEPRRLAMGEAARRLARPDAARVIAAHVIALAGGAA